MTTLPASSPASHLASQRSSAQDLPSAALADVLRHPGIWRRGASVAANVRTQPSGHAALDALLPGGGWPLGALIEILVENDGIGELGLIMPALAALTRARRRVALIAPPYIPYPPALEAAGIDLDQLVRIDAGAGDTHWSAEQCLRAGCCAAIVHWLPKVDYKQLRRLQLASESGDALAFLLRPSGAADQASPAPLRLLVSSSGASTSSGTSTCVEILKCRGSMNHRRETRIALRAS